MHIYIYRIFRSWPDFSTLVYGELRPSLGFDRDKGNAVMKKCMYQHQMCSFTLSTTMATCDMTSMMKPTHSPSASLTALFWHSANTITTV